MRTSNGIQYPDTIAMAFAPVLFVSTDNDVVRLEVTLTNGEGASVTVSHDAFGGACYVDMSDYVQGMYGDVSMPEDGTMSKSPMMKMMTYSVRKLTTAWSLAVDGAQLASGAAHQIPAFKEDLPLHHDRAALDEPGEGHGGDGLAGAGFAHQPYALAVGDGEIDALDGLLAGGFEGDVQIAYLKHLRHLPVPRSKGRSPAPAG